MAEPNNLLDELILEATGGEEENVREYVATTGRLWRYRVPRDADEIAKIIRRGKTLVSRQPAQMPEKWRPYLPLSEQTAQAVATLETCLLDPRLPTLDLIVLSKKAGGYFLEIASQVRAAMFGAQETRDVEAIDDLGEDSGETD